MSESSLLKEIIQAGHDLTSIKYYSLATSVVFFYDFLLTLGDEIKYGWSGQKSWVFGLFIANRYLPLVYQFWVLTLCFRPKIPHRACEETAWIPILAFVECTLLAQVALTLRIFAITRKNRRIAACFTTLTISQLGLGIYFTVSTAKKGAEVIPPIPIDAFVVCFFVRNRTMELAFTAISLLFDLSAFTLIIYLAVRSYVYQTNIPSLFKIIAEDATLYFLVIFTSHLVLEMTLIFAKTEIQLLPGPGNVVYLPIMITRIMLSLKKAAVSKEDLWSLGEPSVVSAVGFAGPRRVPPASGDEIGLDTIGSRYEAASRA